MDFAVLSLALLLTLLVAAVGVHLTEWHLYVSARNERDTLRQDLLLMTADRDGWRSVGERALLVAHLGTRITLRATHLTIDVPEPEAQER